MDLCVDPAVAALVDEALRLFRPLAERNGVELAVAVAPDLPLLNADERALKQMVINLVSNAVKFTKPGGRIRVTAAPADGGLAITVADTGIGIPADKLATVFEPFGQVDDGLHAAQGTGLGLPLVKRLVDLHGGSLTLDSTPKQGTTVCVLFPPERLAEG